MKEIKKLAGTIMSTILFFFVTAAWAFDPESFHQVLGLDLGKIYYNFDEIQKEWGPAVEVVVGDAVASRKEISYTTKTRSEYLTIKSPECERGWVLETAAEYRKDNPVTMGIRVIDARGSRFSVLGDVRPPRLMKCSTFVIQGVQLGMSRKVLESLFPTKRITKGYTVKIKKSGSSERYDYTHQETGKDSDDETPWVREDTTTFEFEFDFKGRLVRFEISNMDCG